LPKLSREGEPPINVDADFEVGTKRWFVEYDGWFWHKDKVAADTQKAQVLTQYGSVLRIRDQLPAIEGCDNLIIDSTKDKGDAMYRKTFEHVGGQASDWPAVWKRAQSLPVRTCNYLRDNKQQTVDTLFPAAQPQAGPRSSGRVCRPSVRLCEPSS
jgi:hypothetical protein